MTTASPSRPLPLLSLLVCAGLSLGALAPRDAGAQAMIVMKDVCDDPAATFDYQWARINHDVTAAFLMQPGGSIEPVENADPRGLAAYPRIFVAAHGGDNTLSGMPYDEFAENLHKARAATPQLTYFAVCGAGKGPASLLKRVNDRYCGGIAELQGGVTRCALTGNGKAALAGAQYRIEAEKSDPARHALIQKNIIYKWENDNYPGQQLSYKNVCKKLIKASPFQGEPLAEFMSTVYHEFTRPAVDPKRSTNYLELIAINQNGQPLTQCGADPTGNGVKVACP